MPDLDEERRGRSPGPTMVGKEDFRIPNLELSPPEGDGEEVFTSSDSADTSRATSPLIPSSVADSLDDSKYAQLQSTSIEGPKRTGTISTVDTNDGDASIAKPFERSVSPSTTLYRSKAAEYEKVSEQGVGKMHKFTVYETASRFYIVAADIMDMRFRILKIDRTDEPGNLNISEDEIIYTKKEMSSLLNTVDDGNKSTGGLRLRNSTWGILGFIRFTGPYYMLLITKRSQVALIGGHYVYQIDGTELVPLTPGSGSKAAKPDLKNATEEARFLASLNNLDLSRSFYFSYSYDITHTLQHNLIRERDNLANDVPYPHKPDYNSMFVWNTYLLQPATCLKSMYDWCIPIIHGYVDQAALSVYGRSVWITIIARRSRYFAGARFLKRGANDLGYVANDVESEQIVCDSLTTSFHAPGPRLYANPNYSSYVQHRGSIPLYWTQENTGVAPKPPIELNLVDPFYSASALHFDNLFERYGAPVYILNLVKTRERTARESKLLEEFTNAVNYLNQFLPGDKNLLHKAWDMSRASKNRYEDVIGTLETIADEVLDKTGFFRNGDGLYTMPRTQNGVARTNCIDCLDRTNAAQFVIGKRALGHQLHALGIISSNSLAYDTDAVNLFTHMFHDHGDTIAVQYGGSHLVNTMETYRKINQWTSQSRDMVETFKRYYNNSFLDGQRQEAYNLFLGNYIWTQGQPMVWELANDYYLHHADPRAYSQKKHRNYANWFTPEFLEPRTMKSYSPEDQNPRKDKLLLKNHGHSLSYYDNYWLEYYKPLALSSFQKIFPYKMNSTVRYIPLRSTQDGRYDLSPFKVRTELDQDIPDKATGALQRKKGVKIVDPNDESIIGSDNDSIRSNRTSVTNPKLNSTSTTARTGIQRWLQPIHEKPPTPNPSNLITHGIMKEPLYPSSELRNQNEPPQKVKLTTLDKSKAAQWSFRQVVQESLNPSVTEQEMDDYRNYITGESERVEVDEYIAHISGQYVSGTRGGDRFWGGYDNTNTPHHENNINWGSGMTIGASGFGTGFGVNSGNGLGLGALGVGGIQGVNEEDIAEFVGSVEMGKLENPLDVGEDDKVKKRYKAYRKWLRGKSLFKQQPVD